MNQGHDSIRVLHQQTHPSNKFFFISVIIVYLGYKTQTLAPRRHYRFGAIQNSDGRLVTRKKASYLKDAMWLGNIYGYDVDTWN